jgi:hypothetical protein
LFAGSVVEAKDDANGSVRLLLGSRRCAQEEK